jgi:hypothetical protein
LSELNEKRKAFFASKNCSSQEEHTQASVEFGGNNLSLIAARVEAHERVTKLESDIQKLDTKYQFCKTEAGLCKIQELILRGSDDSQLKAKLDTFQAALATLAAEGASKDFYPHKDSLQGSHSLTKLIYGQNESELTKASTTTRNFYKALDDLADYGCEMLNNEPANEEASGAKIESKNPLPSLQSKNTSALCQQLDLASKLRTNFIEVSNREHGSCG